MTLFVSLFSRRRSRQAREENALASDAAGAASAVQKNGTNQKAPRVELDLPHIKPSEGPPRLEFDIEPRDDDDKPVNPASVELPTSPQNGRPESPGTVVSKKRSLLSVRSLQGNDGQQPFSQEGRRRPRRISVFSSLRSRPSTAMSTATEPVPELPRSPISPHSSRTYFPPDPKFQLDLKPEAFGKAFNGSTLPFVEEVFGDNPETSSQSPGWQSRQKTSTTSDSGNHVSREWTLPDLSSVINGDTSNTNTNTNTTVTQPGSPANGTSTQQTTNAYSETTEKSSSETLPSPPLPTSSGSGSVKSTNRNSLKRFLSKRQPPHLLRGNTPSPPTATTSTTTTNGVAAE
ncbi:uncharacterized protein GIQ15_06736 [Arthroderma uncinatum]|uniref:uncharacterized protein n=1 Tax=Arthroderma uncinatum TaxID=74035 RepID=UPI00144A73E0|nr:uncharacterized protein GIQ15_06736 [Arthroderma uncinatum]KAF3479760.1 hypothetical protein GIQ15_06736 [Arthroderma uncinatum]